jgi:hypothetical protein
MQISCPQCARSLEAPYPLPARAQCPFCSLIFSPVMPAPRPLPEAAASPPPPVPVPVSPFAPPAMTHVPPHTELRSYEQLRLPAIGMIVGGVLSLLYALLDLALCVHFLVGFQQGQAPPNLPPWMQNIFQPNPTQMTIEAVLDAVKVVSCAVVIYGAMRMQRLESYGLAITSCILSIIPCMTCCCFLGMPFGIWSLVILNRPEVRASFR